MSKHWKCSCDESVYEEQSIFDNEDNREWLKEIKQQAFSLENFLVDFKDEITTEMFTELTQIADKLQRIIEGGMVCAGNGNNQ